MSTQTPEVSVQETLQQGGVADFSDATFTELQTSGQRFAVFLGASWCPGCVRLSQQIREQESVLPEGTAVLIGDYDVEKEFGGEYGVYAKHTAVYFDENGDHTGTQAGVLFADIMNHLRGES